MLNTRRKRLWTRALTVVASAVIVAISAPAASAWAGTVPDAARPLTAADPFHGQIPGDVSNGHGALPPVTNAPSAGAVLDNAMPGANTTQTRFGPIDDTDRLFLVKVRQAGLWERPSCLYAIDHATDPRLRDICHVLASDHVALDAENTFVAKQLNVALPNQPNSDQQAWMRDIWSRQGHVLDVNAVKWLRFAHGGVFTAIAQVRMGTRNDLMRMMAERANDMVNKHMSLLESTGLVQYSNLPHAAIGVPAAALAAATNPTPKNTNMLRPTVVALVIVTGLLALVSVRRVVRGS